MISTKINNYFIWEGGEGGDIREGHSHVLIFRFWLFKAKTMFLKHSLTHVEKSVDHKYTAS